MAQVNYSAEVVDLDQPAREAQAERPGKPVIFRVQPTLYRMVSGAAGQNRVWRGVSWSVECQDAEEAIAVRDALRSFFETLSQEGAAAAQAKLDTTLTTVGAFEPKKRSRRATRRD